MARALALLVTLLLAGCVEPSDAPEAVEPGAVEEAADDVAKATPAERVDLGHMPHMHNYWGEKDRVVLYDGPVEPNLEESVAVTAYDLWTSREAGRVGGAAFRLPDGATVYEGTGALEVTVSWTDPTITGIALAWKSAETPEWTEAAPLANGEVFTIDVAPEMTDLPHMTVSRWQFAFLASGTPGLLVAPFDAKFEIVRLRDVMEFPAHPELFGGKPQKVIHEAPGKSAQVSYAKRVPNLVLEGEFGEHWITPQQLVPMETLAMRFEVTITKAEANVGEVSEIRLYYTPASSTQPMRAPLVSGSLESKSLVYEIEVDSAMVDSPYAPESQWKVLVEAATTLAGEGRTCGGCVDTEIEFTLRVTAFDHALEKAAGADGMRFSVRER